MSCTTVRLKKKQSDTNQVTTLWAEYSTWLQTVSARLKCLSFLFPWKYTEVGRIHCSSKYNNLQLNIIQGSHLSPRKLMPGCRLFLILNSFSQTPQISQPRGNPRHFYSTEKDCKNDHMDIIRVRNLV